ncbi:alpha/beta hydrolase [Sphingomonas sp. ABOLD]|uniref:Proline iminopeptidase n=1 Tax=Sphingomonas trueperi TaxID=53317 RepID=A0A7X6BEI4_9SPHN|nr:MULTISPECIES: alpha/beta hydrolase [Sphingomonas]NJB98807.1 proline iminopeptidase [Sphingomonas trueperi]RSV52383.1 alpha/beta hydrolase [Sphingomonas sp. ABOLD]
MPSPFPQGSHTLIVADIPQHVHVAGTGPCCIVHSGGPGIDSGYLRMPLLEAHCTMVYLDPIGTGASGRLPTHPMGYSVDRFADQLVALLDAMAVHRPYLLGHSHGAFVVLEAALRRPDAVAGLLLYAGAASTGGGFMAAAAARIDDFVRRHRDTPDAESVRAAWNGLPAIRSDAAYTATLRGLLPAYFSNPARSAEVLAALRRRLHATFLVGDSAPFDVRDRLATLTTPTLVMAGRDDFILGPEFADRLTEHLPDARQVLFEQSGHFAHLEEPEAFAKAVLDFVASTRGDYRSESQG